jgi:chitinase
MPRDKILLGIPSYGYINTSTKTSLRQRSIPVGGPHRSDMRHAPEKRAPTLTSMDGTTGSGQINFNQIVAQGALKKGPDGLFDAAGGYTKYWDDCSDTPFLANGKRVITYDDTSSIYDKGAFANAAGIGGVSMWSLDGDTAQWDLTNAAIAGMSASA